MDLLQVYIAWTDEIYKITSEWKLKASTPSFDWLLSMERDLENKQSDDLRKIGRWIFITGAGTNQTLSF